jgi:ABC-type multidrug transport system ATPase subunit
MYLYPFIYISTASIIIFIISVSNKVVHNVGFIKPGYTFPNKLAYFSYYYRTKSIYKIMNLSINNVSKKYPGNVWGIRDFTLSAGPGVLGLLGPNGAGKSTLMRMIATITRPTQGSVTWNGKDIVKAPNELRSVLGYLPQDFGIYPNLNAVEFLEYIAAAKGIGGKSLRDRINDLIQLVNLTGVSHRPLGGYSGGIKQRVGIAQALLNDPKLLIVDEPTGGLDPEERVRFRNLLSELSGERIVILSTHIVSDIEAVATEIAIVKEGKLIAHMTPEKLLETVDGKVWEWTIPSTQLSGVKEKFIVTSTARRSDGLKARIISQMKPHSDAQAVTPSLEDAYLFCINRGKGAA